MLRQLGMMRTDSDSKRELDNSSNFHPTLWTSGNVTEAFQLKTKRNSTIPNVQHPKRKVNGRKTGEKHDVMNTKSWENDRK